MIGPSRRRMRLFTMPAHTSHLLKSDDMEIGERIRDARQRQGVTLKTLAARVETSAARLSQIQNDRVGLDVGEILLVRRRAWSCRTRCCCPT